MQPIRFIALCGATSLTFISPVLATELSTASKAAPVTKVVASQASPSPILQQAQDLRAKGAPLEAISILRAALTSGNDEPAVRIELGYALTETNQEKEAVVEFDAVLSQNPLSAKAIIGKAVAFDHSGNHLAAQDLYERALEIDADSVAVRNNLSMSMILNNQLPQAIALLEKLQTESPENPTVRQNLALAYGVSGNLEKARELLSKDMPQEQVEENLRFYTNYMAERAKSPAKAQFTDQIGFRDAPKVAN